ncbi:DUF4102 domain-containing protein [Providencia rettgeri]|nr:DUF4102 domain-containing protein [Providencia rettgeri]MBS0914995.1 DUF4102 domain-containing protein [Providencia rettgeri]
MKLIIILADARRKRDDAKRLLVEGIGPNQQPKEQKLVEWAKK